MPIQTIGSRPNAEPRRSRRRGRCSRRSDRSISASRAGVQVDALGLDLRQHLARLRAAARRDEEPRRLGDGRGEEQIQQGRDQAGAEHPLPGLDAEQLVVDVPPAQLRDGVVDELGDRDAQHDGELLEGAQPAPVGGRRDLRDVGGAEHRRHPDPRAGEHPPERQVPDPERQGLADRADREQDRGDLHGPGASPAVGQPSGDPGAARRAEQRDRHHEAGRHRAHLEVALDPGDGAVDHGAVVAEEEAAYRRRRGDEDDAPQMFPVRARSSGGRGTDHDGLFPDAGL